MKSLCLYLLTFFSACRLLANAGEVISTNLAPAFNAQVVLSFGRAGQGATSTTTLLSSVRSATNRHDLPGGTLEFFCFYEGQRRGKDIWTVGEKYPVGATNQTVVTKRIDYEGKRASVRLNKDDLVVIEPLKEVK
jgi:hypothetical protein